MKNKFLFFFAALNRFESDKDALGGDAHYYATLMCYNIARARSPIMRGILCLFKDKIHAYMFPFVSGIQKDFTECKEILC